MSHPYETLPERNFWRAAVGLRNPFDFTELHVPRIEVGPQDRFVTAGSCFAQHISRAISQAGMQWIDAEPAPPYLVGDDAKAFSYGVFSFRTSNIYTTAMLRQWLEWAADPAKSPDLIWEDKGRCFDPFRPSIEPNGFADRDETLRVRHRTLLAIRTAIERASVFVFTLGLTEAWRSRSRGLFYAACPGTLAGSFDPEDDEFVNLDYPQTRAQLEAAIAIMRNLNPKLKVLLTVSPVPLTASADKTQHVLAATTYSKSTLRAVAGDLSNTLADLDYFPSYEIITAPAFRGIFFEPNMRSVNDHGVAHVMKHFFASYGLPPAPLAEADTLPGITNPADTETADDLVCEEEILDFYDAN